MKYVRNGQSSGSLTPLWPMMRGYGLDQTELESQSFPTAGTGGEYEAEWDSGAKLTEAQAMMEAVTEQGQALHEQIDLLEAMLEEDPVPPELTEEPESLAPHPYETEEGGTSHPDMPTIATDSEYVGGTEVGPEASTGTTYTTPASETSRWPLYVGVGAGVLGLVGIIAVVVANRD